MSWEQFVHIGTTIVYWTILWALISIPAALILFAIGRFFPSEPTPAARAIMAHRPASSDATMRFKEERAGARAKLELGTIRIILDRKHARLKRELTQIRATLDRRLQQITRASSARGGASLVDLLNGFKEDTDRALQFSDIEDNLVEQTTARSKARFIVGTLSFFALVITVVNGGLLYLFFDELYAGLTVPFLSIPLALVLALLFPIAETAGGVGSELALDKSDSASTKLIIFSGIALIIIALASVEFMIFYELWDGLFKQLLSFERGGYAHKLVALMGPGLTAAQAVFGFGVARNMLRLKELGAVKSIKDHVVLAQRFVNGLEARYDRIEEAAARASQSIEEFVAQVKGRGEAEMPAVALLAEERTKFVEAVDAVNPTRWKRQVEPSAGDTDAVTAYAWFLPIAVTLGIAVFAFVFAPAIAESGLFPQNKGIAVWLAVAAAFAALVAGGALFDRATSAIEHDANWKDVLSPRDGAFKVVSIFVLGSLAVGIVWICVAADGVVGFGQAAILVAIVAGLCWASSYIDLMLRGLAYVAAMATYGMIWLIRTALRLGWTALLLAAAGLIALALLLLHLLAWPVTLVRSVSGRRDAASAPVASLS
jgi:hypothetical protein